MDSLEISFWKGRVVEEAFSLRVDNLMGISYRRPEGVVRNNSYNMGSEESSWSRERGQSTDRF
jgi:hypothetical protein